MSNIGYYQGSKSQTMLEFQSVIEQTILFHYCANILINSIGGKLEMKGEKIWKRKENKTRQLYT